MRHSPPDHSHRIPLGTGRFHASLRGGRILALSVLALAAGRLGHADDWATLPVYSRGRLQPLATVALHATEQITGRSQVTDPETGHVWEPAEWYVELLRTWEGWQRAERELLRTSRDQRPFYFHWHRADRWDQAALFPVPDSDLRECLGLPADRERCSASELQAARIRDEVSGTLLPFALWAARLQERPAASQVPLHREAMRLADRLATYQDLRMGRGIFCVTASSPLGSAAPASATPTARPPFPSITPEAAVDLLTLALTRWEPARDPTGDRQRIQAAWERWLADEGSGRADLQEAFRVAHVHSYGPSVLTRMRLEFAYHQIVPLRLAWLTGLTTLVLLAGLSVGQIPGTARVGIGGTVLALSLAVLDLCWRGWIDQFVPLANGYGFLATTGGLLAAGALLLRGSAAHWLRAGGLAAATVAWLLLDPAWSPLDRRFFLIPVELQTNFWLVAHVGALTVATALLVLAALSGSVALTLRFPPSDREDSPAPLSRNSGPAQLLRWSILGLAVGLASGAVWNEQTWGSCWHWSAREAGALSVLLLASAAVLAAQRGWIGLRGLTCAAHAAAGGMALVAVGLATAGSPSHHEYLGLQSQAMLLFLPLAALAGLLILALLRSGTGDEPAPATEAAATPSLGPNLRVVRDP